MAVHQDMEVDGSPPDVVAVSNGITDEPETEETYPTEGATSKVLLKLNGERNDMTDKYIELMNLSLNSENFISIGDSENTLQESMETILLLMKSGEQCNFDIQNSSSDNVFKPCPSAIRSETGLYNLQLVSFENASNINRLSDLSMFDRAKQFKELGNKLYKVQNIEMSFKKYSRSLKYLVIISDTLIKENPDLKEEYNTLKSQIYLNLAACQLQYKGYCFAAENCNKALNLQPANVKAFYRRGLAYEGLDELELAMEDFEKVLELDPANKTARNELTVVKSKFQTQTAGLAKAMSKMFTN